MLSAVVRAVLVSTKSGCSSQVCPVAGRPFVEHLGRHRLGYCAALALVVALPSCQAPTPEKACQQFVQTLVPAAQEQDSGVAQRSSIVDGARERAQQKEIEDCVRYTSDLKSKDPKAYDCMAKCMTTAQSGPEFQSCQRVCSADWARRQEELARRDPVVAAKQEWLENVRKMVTSLAVYAETTQALPESTPPVPTRLSEVEGKTYQSRAEDWATGGWAQIRFKIAEPQRLQYRWVLQSKANGNVEAVGDLDADGVADIRMSLAVGLREGRVIAAPQASEDIAPVLCTKHSWGCGSLAENTGSNTR